MNNLNTKIHQLIRNSDYLKLFYSAKIYIFFSLIISSILSSIIFFNPIYVSTVNIKFIENNPLIDYYPNVINSYNQIVISNVDNLKKNYSNIKVMFTFDKASSNIMISNISKEDLNVASNKIAESICNDLFQYNSIIMNQIKSIIKNNISMAINNLRLIIFLDERTSSLKLFSENKSCNVILSERFMFHHFLLIYLLNLIFSLLIYIYINKN